MDRARLLATSKVFHFIESSPFNATVAVASFFAGALPWGVSLYMPYLSPPSVLCVSHRRPGKPGSLLLQPAAGWRGDRGCRDSTPAEAVPPDRAGRLAGGCEREKKPDSSPHCTSE